jgi:diacylglycerol kinase family enzyme
VREVAEGLVHSDVPFAIVPAGSGNGLAREIRVPRDPARALERAVDAPARIIDAGRIGGRVFVNVAGLGVDARVAARFNAQRATGRGLITYALATITELRRGDPVRGTFRGDGGEPLVLEAAVVAIANSGQYGNGARIAPGAALDDGLLDVVVVGAAGLASTLWRARRLYTGTVLRDPTVVHRRIARATITCSAPILFHVDGDAVQGGVALDVDVLAGALLVKG